MTKIVAISNQKGGVAKTTTTFSLGACLVELGYSTLVVDLDSQSNLTMAAGLDPDELTWTIADLFDSPGGAILEEIRSAVIQPTTMDGLTLLPADVRLASVERNLYDKDNYEYLLKQTLQFWPEFDYILLDCPPSLSAITLMALTAAQTVLIPVQSEYYAARGLGRLLDIVEAVQARTNPTLLYYLFVTMFDKRNNINHSVLEQLQTHFADHLLETIIGVDTRLRESPVAGEPIIHYAPSTRSSEQYRALTREFDARINTQKSQEV